MNNKGLLPERMKNDSSDSISNTFLRKTMPYAEVSENAVINCHLSQHNAVSGVKR